MDKYINTIIEGDCYDYFDKLPKDLVLITDPPYGINYDPKWLSDIHIAKGTQPNKSDKKVLNDKGELDFTPLYSYPRRCIFGFPYIYDLKATGWIVWDKQPQVDGRGMTTPVEIASTTLRKGFDLIHSMWAGFLRDIPDRNIESRYDHPTQKPLKVMKFIIERFTKPDDIIFDPFAGSGSTLVAAKQLGRRYIGIELDSQYVEIANNRLSQYMLF